jgi:hypothetical protein
MLEQGHASDADDVSEDKSDDWTNQTVSSTFSATVTITLPQNPLKVPAIAAEADRCKISSRQMTIMLGAVLGSGGATANDDTLSQITTVKTRNIAREKAFTEVHASFKPPEMLCCTGMASSWPDQRKSCVDGLLLWCQETQRQAFGIACLGKWYSCKTDTRQYVAY